MSYNYVELENGFMVDDENLPYGADLNYLGLEDENI